MAGTVYRDDDTMTHRRGSTTRRMPLLLTYTPLLWLALLSTACVVVVDSGPGRPGESHYRSGDLTSRFEVWASGKIDLTPDDRQVSSITPGGFLHVEERRAFRTRRVRVEPGPGGALEITHTVNGRTQPAGAASDEELARLFARVIQRTGIGVEMRVRRLLSTRGVDSVLEAAGDVEGSRVVRRYLDELLMQTRLSAAHLRRVAELASRRIPSSGTRASFLIDAWAHFDDQTAAHDSFFDAVVGIASGGSQARVLVAILDDPQPPAVLGHVLRAARAISSNGTKTRVLLAATDHFRNDAVIRDAFFAAVESISSSGDQARALVALLERDDLDDGSYLSLTRSAGTISSNGEKARVLVAAAPRFSNQPEPRDAYLAATSSIGSSGEQARVLIRLLRVATLDAPAVEALLRSAQGIASGDGRTRVLLAAVDIVRDDDGLLRIYEEVARNLPSRDDRRRALTAIGLSADEA